MIACNRLRGLAVVMAAVLVLPAGSLEARTKKGDKLVKLARDAEAERNYDKALDYYEQALSQDPQDPGYQLGSRRMRFLAGQAHVEAGMRLKNNAQPRAGAGRASKGLQPRPRIGHRRPADS